VSITEPRNIEKDKYTVAEKILYLKNLLLTVKAIKFFDLFRSDNSKSAILNKFLALLELLKRQFVTASQDKTYGDILISLKEGAESISLEDLLNEESKEHN
jgi:chromatin segregation and condensation protein Rec8/ScpA/Scc1 (kleisin family)